MSDVESSAGSSCATGENHNSELERLCFKIHRKLAISLHEELPVAAHKSATIAMLAARDALLEGHSVGNAGRTALLCAGIACYKRMYVCELTESARTDMQTTTTLLFVLSVLCDPRHSERRETRGGEDQSVALRDDQQLVTAWRSRCLSQLFSHKPATSSWSEVLTDDAAVSRAALSCAASVDGAGAVEKTWILARVFFAASASAMASALLNSAHVVEDSADFLTLDTLAFMQQANAEADSGLAALVQSADSEAGQEVFRDILLSFILPAHAVGVRRTLLLGREANRIATANFTAVVNEAHEAAMRGAVHEWEHGAATSKACALLAGLAIVLSRGKSVRKSDAFAGRLALPFLQTVPSSGYTIGLVDRCFVCFTMKGDAPQIAVRGKGFEGLCACVSALVKNLRV